MSGRMEEYRVSSYKAQMPPEIPFRFKPGQNTEEISFGEAI